MATGFNIANLFRNAPPQNAAPAPAPTAPPSPTPAPPPEQNSPLDAFKSMWQTDGKSGTAENPDPFSAPLFNSDPAKIREATSQMDFSRELPQELMSRVMAGNDPQAIVEMVNAVAQKALATSLQLATATTEQAGQRMGERFKTALPSQFRDLQIQNQRPSNPILDHPATKPLLDSVRQRLKLQNPDWQPQQIQAEAEKYFTDFAASLQEADPSQVAARKAAAAESGEDMNWMEWAKTSAVPR